MNKQLVVLLGLALTAAGCNQLTKVRDRNVAVAAGQAAYARGDAASAADDFAAALAARARRVPDPRLILNLGHAQIRAAQANAARETYGRLLTDNSPFISSVARQQLAVLAARQGKVAQALGQLRQALVLNPANSGARYNYEVLSDYLARQQAPAMPPPAADTKPKEQPAATKSGKEKKHAEKAGTDKPGELAKPDQTQNLPTSPPDSRPDDAGQPNRQQPSGAAGNSAAGSRSAGTGVRQPIASGTAPGQQRGLDVNGAVGRAASAGASRRAGTEAALPEDERLQTQRERLRAMNLSPAQARQLLDALRAQEQQYLQQLTRPAPTKPDPNKPTW